MFFNPIHINSTQNHPLPLKGGPGRDVLQPDTYKLRPIPPPPFEGRAGEGCSSTE